MPDGWGLAAGSGPHALHKRAALFRTLAQGLGVKTRCRDAVADGEPLLRVEVFRRAVNMKFAGECIAVAVPGILQAEKERMAANLRFFREEPPSIGPVFTQLAGNGGLPFLCDRSGEKGVKVQIGFDANQQINVLASRQGIQSRVHDSISKRFSFRQVAGDNSAWVLKKRLKTVAEESPTDSDTFSKLSLCGEIVGIELRRSMEPTPMRRKEKFSPPQEMPSSGKFVPVQDLSSRLRVCLLQVRASSTWCRPMKYFTMLSLPMFSL